MKRIYKIIATLFFIGYIPFAPGTFGTLAALFLYYFIRENIILFSAFLFITLALGFFTVGAVERLSGKKDPRFIIIDEFCGMLLALYLLPARPWVVVAAFILFRFFDVVKVKPIDKLEEMAGGFGIMADDLVAGLYTNLVLQVICRIPY